MSMNENRPGGSGKSPKRTPRFSFYWIYAVVFAVLIGMQLFGPLAPNMVKSNEKEFKELVAKGQVEKYLIIDNRNTVRVYLNEAGVKAQTARLKEVSGKVVAQGPHMSFRITGGEAFQKSMADFYGKTNPPIPEVIYDVDNERDWFGGILQFLLPVLLFIGIWVLFMRKMGGPAGGGGGGGGIFSIGKSKATLFDKGTKVSITFADVAGLDEAKVEVMEIVDFLKNPKKYTNLGGKIPKGALLIGPPGTGKTLLAKAVAGEAQVPFFSLSGSDFVEMFVGVGATLYHFHR